MASIIAVLSGLGAKLATGLGAAGSSLAANAGTIGTILSAAGTVYGGVQAKKSADFEAESLKKKGDSEFAIGQRNAMRRRQEKELLLSRQRAVAAGSGAGATGGSVDSIMGKTEEVGEYNALLDMYNGEISRADLYGEAATRKSEGKSALVGSFIDAGAGVYSDIAKKKRSTAELSYPY